MKLVYVWLGALVCLGMLGGCSSAPEPVPEEGPAEAVLPPEPAPVEAFTAEEPEPVFFAVEPAEAPFIGFSLEAALRRSCDTLIEALPDTSSIALISIASENLTESRFAVDELSFLLLDSRLFNLVERRTLDLIVNERPFQPAAAVDDAAALLIGHRTGAEIVMTGTISVHESEKYLRLRAIDVESKAVLALTSESFID